jgi:hypothetical protein
MENQLKKKLQILMRITTKTPEAHRLEEMEAAAKTHLILYRQEKDPEGEAIYARMLQLIKGAKSAKELEAMV